MKYKLAALLLIAICMACNNGPRKPVKLPAPAAGEKTATFAGGCFWAMQECMQELKGVRKVISGYAGGETPDPSYEQVSARNTGHAEAVEVYYDPKVISFEQLTEAFFHAHDPTQLNRQGPDVGSDYRSIAFYRNAEEQKIIADVIARVNASGEHPDPVVTEIVPFRVIYPAENYHQNYYNLHPNERYIINVSKPKVMKLRKAMPELIKPEYN